MEKQKIYFLTDNHKNICDEDVVCPNCGSITKYGELIMYNSYSGCPHCYKSLRDKIEKAKEIDYDLYVRSNMYKLSKLDYDEICKKLRENK
jgi:protein-arginine kinase activator protein McsA